MDVRRKAASIPDTATTIDTGRHLDLRDPALPTIDKIMAISCLPYVSAISERVAYDDDLREQFDKIAEADWLCLYRAAMRTGIEPSDAEDVVQETLLRAYRRLTAMSLKQRVALPVHSWLKSVATNVARERLDRVRRQRAAFN